MAKKSDEKDILLVRDEKTGELGVVGGLRSDGSPRTARIHPVSASTGLRQTRRRNCWK